MLINGQAFVDAIEKETTNLVSVEERKWCSVLILSNRETLRANNNRYVTNRVCFSVNISTLEILSLVSSSTPRESVSSGVGQQVVLFVKIKRNSTRRNVRTFSSTVSFYRFVNLASALTHSRFFLLRNHAK